MKRLLLFSALFFAIVVQSALGQIQLNSAGNVSVGVSTPHTDRGLNVWDDDPSSFTSTIYARYNGVGPYNANAIFARATTTAGYGHGGTLHGGARGARGFSTLSGSSSRIGIYGEGGNGTLNYGLYGYGYGGNANYGIYAYTSGSGTNYAGYFNGNVTVTGTFSNPSDSRFKEDVVTMERQAILAKLVSLRPVTYRFKQALTTGFEDLNLPQGLHYGLIAEELEQVFPELVHDQIHASVVDETGEVGEDTADITTSSYKSVNYIELIPLLLSALQEQQAEIDALQDALDALQN